MCASASLGGQESTAKPVSLIGTTTISLKRLLLLKTYLTLTCSVIPDGVASINNHFWAEKGFSLVSNFFLKLEN